MEASMDEPKKAMDDFPICSICMEAYDLEHRLPKSLDCRHYFCAPCLTSHLESQKRCPLCQRQIDNIDNIVNELAMIDYLQRQQEQKRKEQQKAMREELHGMISTKEQEHERMEEKMNHFKRAKLKMTQDKSRLYSVYAKYLLKKSLEHCNNEASLTRIASRLEQEMEYKLQEIRQCQLIMEELLGNDYIGKEDFDNCQTEISVSEQTESTVGNVDDRMWDAYREMLLEQLTEVTNETKSNEPDFIPGNKHFSR